MSEKTEKKRELKKKAAFSQKGAPKPSTARDGFFSPTDLKKFKRVEESVLQFFRKDDCKNLSSKLKKEFPSYNLAPDKIADFFIANGGRLLRSSLIMAINENPINSLIDIIPSHALKEVLHQGNPSNLWSFVFGRMDYEKRGLYDIAEENSQIGKFKALLHIDREGVKSFMEASVVKNQELRSKKIYANYKLALERLTKAAEENDISYKAEAF